MCRDGVVVLCLVHRDDNPSHRATTQSSFLEKATPCAALLVRLCTTRRHLRAEEVLFLSAPMQPCRASNARWNQNRLLSTNLLPLRNEALVVRQV